MHTTSIPGVFDLLQKAQDNGIRLSCRSDELVVQVRKGKAVDPSFLQEINEQKEQLVACLKRESIQSSVRSPFNSLEDNSRKTCELPLSFSQERLWFIDQFEKDNAYHISFMIWLGGKPDFNSLEFALREIVNRHTILRTVIRQMANGNRVQELLEPGDWKLLQLNKRGYADPAELEYFIKQLCKEPFNLSTDYLLRAHFICTGEQEHALVITMHHIASDRWSVNVFLKELMELYNSIIENRAPVLPALPVQYSNFANWQREYLQNEILEQKLNYWEKKLAGVTPLDLPVDYARPAVQGHKGALVHYSIDASLAKRLKDLSQREGATLFMTLLAAFKVLLFRYSGQEDICVGTPIAGRQYQELEGLIGFFINTLALRSYINGETSFSSFLQNIKETTLDAYEHQGLPFEKLVERLVKDRDIGRSPLFQVMFALQNTAIVKDIKLNALATRLEYISQDTSMFDLSFIVTEYDDGLRLMIEYCTDLYDEATINRMSKHYERLLYSITENAGCRIGLLQLMNNQEKIELAAFNISPAVSQDYKNIIQVFEEQVKLHPFHTAIVFNGQKISYTELKQRADAVARQLYNEEVKAGERVGICTDRGPNMIVAMLGILKIGAAYVPMDPSYPNERTRFILNDASISIVLSEGNCVDRIAEHKAGLIDLDKIHPEYHADQSKRFNGNFSNTDLAYIIYTSGSTGKPKGVMVEHRSVVELVHSQSAAFNFTDDERVIQFSNYCFDASVEQIFLALLTGNTLVLFPEQLQLDISLFEELIRKESITHLDVTPGFLENIQPGTYSGLKRVIAGGELCRKELAHRWSRYVDFYNAYGPTETTITALEYHIPAGMQSRHQSLPIGKPLAHVSACILDKNQNQLPVGVWGELYIGGSGVTRGYLNQFELTNRLFIPDPFSREKGGRLYRTGDRARWLPDGNMEYGGRVDEQVKIRGYRIEPSEIEQVLQQNPLVRKAAVRIVNIQNEMPELAAYIVAGEVFDMESILQHLNNNLPGYMVPSFLVEVDQLPLTLNGKIDWKKLPVPNETMRQGTNYIAPRNVIEKKLASIWKSLLNVEKVGMHDNFFRLGGHSLLVTRVIATIRREMNLEVSVRDLFTYATIEQLARMISERGIVKESRMQVNARPERIPASFSQERLWFIDQLEGSIAYHIPVVLELKGKINIDCLQHAIHEVIERHEVLRTVIEEKGGMLYQKILHNKWELNIVNCQGVSGYESIRKRIDINVKKPFGLSTDYPVRVDYYDLGFQQNFLVLVLHHIAADGWSVPVIIKDIFTLYDDFVNKKESSLSPLAIQYSDYSTWQHEWMNAERLNNELNFWRQKLAGVATLDIPADYTRPAEQGNRGAIIPFVIEKELMEKLKDISRQQEVTLFTALLSVFKILLYRYTGQEDICVGTPVAGRPDPELENAVGFFVNTLALRTQVNDEYSFISLLQEVKETVLDAYEHQETPFEKIVEAVVQERDRSRSPLFQAMFALNNMPDEDIIEINGLTIRRRFIATGTSKFDINFFVTETAEGLKGGIEYCTDLYSRERILRMAGHYNRLLQSVTAAPATPVGKLSMLLAEEEMQVISDFNNTKVEYAGAERKTILDFFAEQVKSRPEAIALEVNDASITFRQLEEQSSRVAHYLRSHGVEPGSLVMICLERSREMLVGILGIMKAGAAYVPVDPDYPEERIRFIQEDTEANVILTNLNVVNRIIDIKDTLVAPIENIQSVEYPAINEKIDPSQLAYVIYTSGSTGKPKGVMIEHRSLLNRLLWTQQYFQLNEQDVILQKTPFTFDVSVWELLWGLIPGSKLVFAKPEGQKDNRYIQAMIEQHHVSVIHFVPPMLEVFLGDLEAGRCKSLKKIICSGEALLTTQVDLWKRKMPGAGLYNLYGPTEAAIDVTCWNCAETTSANSIPIGKPVANTFIYILDKNNNPVPVGIPGELCIGGIQVARGYLKRPGLTNEKFVADPFAENKEAKMYLTGDLSRWLADGTIEYLGRIDQQVKVRGFRVEPGEIESALQQNSMVKQAVVIAWDDGNNSKKLAAYIVPGENLDIEKITGWLTACLPDYMIPSSFTILEKIPLTANGKIDRKALPAPGVQHEEYTPPSSQMERLLTRIWESLLKTERIGIKDDFFVLGGHSLLATRVVSAIRKETGIDIPIRMFFQLSTIESLARFIEINQPEIEAVANEDDVEMIIG